MEKPLEKKIRSKIKNKNIKNRRNKNKQRSNLSREWQLQQTVSKGTRKNTKSTEMENEAFKLVSERASETRIECTPDGL